MIAVSWESQLKTIHHCATESYFFDCDASYSPRHRAACTRALSPRVMNVRTTVMRPEATMPVAPPRRRTTTWVFSMLMGLLVLSVLAGISLGSISVAPVTVATVLAANVLPQGWINVSRVSEADRAVVWWIRTPRVLVAALVGAGLALAGAQMQGL